MHSRVLTIRDDGDHYEIRYKQEPPYRLPKRDCAPLPIDNTTAERLAEYVAGQLIRALATEAPHALLRLKVGVEEMPGQAGWFVADLGADPE